METCIFCKIASHNIPSTAVYEDDIFFAFMDINPVTKGHILLIPKKHIPWMTDTSDEMTSAIFLRAKKLMTKMKQNIPCDFVYLSIVGEEVPHFHIHLVPRYTGKNVATFTHETYESGIEMEAYATKINQ